MKTRAALLATLCATAMLPSVNAQTPDQLRFYGIELGKPLQVRECPKEQDIINRNVWRYPIFGAPFTCAEAYPDSQGNGRAMLRFPPAESPLYVKNGMIELTIIDGLVQAAEVSTPGFLSQGDVLAELVRKYGQPTTQSTSKAVNGAGASFDNLSASWDISDSLQVHFRGMLARTDEGFLIIGSKRGLEVYKARLEQRSRRSGPAM
jgi:hypothetical protein